MLFLCGRVIGLSLVFYYINMSTSYIFRNNNGIINYEAYNLFSGYVILKVLIITRSATISKQRVALNMATRIR